MEDKKALRKMDLVTSVFLFIISVVGCIMSLQLLLRTINNGKEWFTSAGLFPLIVTLFLGVCSVSLFMTAWKYGARFDFLKKEIIVNLIKSSEFKSGCAVVAILFLYIFTMTRPGKQYEIATFLFMFITMVVFQKRTKRAIINSLIISLVATAVLSYGFGQLAMIPLP